MQTLQNRTERRPPVGDCQSYLNTPNSHSLTPSCVGFPVLSIRPSKAKTFGRKVRNFDEQIWSNHRFDIAVRGNTAKFEQNTALRDWLLSTEGRVLVEASPRDKIWGIGLAADDERALDPKTWRGLNLLGFALMRTRTALQ
jgi:ribA/ribD-fused uncharacterized protein